MAGKNKQTQQLQTIHPRAAGIDIGADEHVAAIPMELADPPVRRFGAFTIDLHALADWLAQHGIQTVVMESTGVYWIPLFELLCERGFEVRLVDTRQLKYVPGRKTDICDAQWLQQLHSYGLLRGAFRPDDQACVLRAFLRQRAMLIKAAAGHIQHMHKAMEQMNVKLGHVVSDITGQTGMSIIRAILAGQRDPDELAKLRDHRCKNDQATIAKALQGNWRQEHLFALQQAVALYDFYQQQIADCDGQIQAVLGQFQAVTDDLCPPPAKPGKNRKPKGNAPAFNVRDDLYRMLGVDLTRIDGVDAYGALQLIGEIGLDITRWPTDAAFASWLGLCPGNKISGGKRQNSKTKQNASRAATLLRLFAYSLLRSQSALGAYLRRMKARLGAAQAITATAHKLARIIWSMLKNKTPYTDPGAEAYDQQFQAKILKNLKRKANALGYQLHPVNPA